MTQHVLEIVTFRASDRVADDDVTQAAAAMTTWLAEQPGFLSRRLGVTADGVWTDCIEWRDAAAAHAAASAFGAEPTTAALMRVIAPGSVQMQHATITFAL